MRWKMSRETYELKLTQEYEANLKILFRNYTKRVKKLTEQYEQSILDSRHEARTNRSSFVGLPRSKGTVPDNEKETALRRILSGA